MQNTPSYEVALRVCATSKREYRGGGERRKEEEKKKSSLPRRSRKIAIVSNGILFLSISAPPVE